MGDLMCPCVCVCTIRTIVSTDGSSSRCVGYTLAVGDVPVGCADVCLARWDTCVCMVQEEGMRAEEI